MSYARILTTFYAEPWALRPDVHASLGRALHHHMQNPAPGQAAMIEDRPRNDEREIGIERHRNVAMIGVRGVIGRHLSLMEHCAGGYDLAQLEAQVYALESSDADAIILNIDSPGGRIGGLPEMAALVARLSQSRRVVAYADGCMCSAAYWLAAGAGEIYAGPSAQVGNIGAYIAAIDSSRAWEMEGLKLELFKSGEKKAIGVGGKEWTDEDRAYMQKKVDEAGSNFRAWVTSRRPQIAREALDGSWHSGAEAQALGLIDGTAISVYDLVAQLMRSPAV